MNTSDWIALIALVVAGFSLYESSRTPRLQALSEILQDYSDPNVGYAIQRLWTFYRVDCKEDGKILEDLFIKQREAEFEAIYQAKDSAEREEKLKNSLDTQRRTAAHFFFRLAILYRDNAVPRGRVLEQWEAADLEVIPRILIPLMNAMRKHVRRGDPLPKDNSLSFLYLEAYNAAAEGEAKDKLVKPQYSCPILMGRR